MRLMRTLGLVGTGLVSLGVIMIILALLLGTGWVGSNVNALQVYLFLALLFGGAVISLMGAGIFIYIGICRRQRAKPASEQKQDST